MPWTTKDYPASMKNLEETTRNKAIEIANALLEDGYEEGRAIPIAISQAKKWAESGASDHTDGVLHVVPHPRGWAIRQVGAKRASFVFEARRDALEKAQEMSADEGNIILLHAEDGEIEERIAAPEPIIG